MRELLDGKRADAPQKHGCPIEAMLLCLDSFKAAGRPVKWVKRPVSDLETQRRAKQMKAPS